MGCRGTVAVALLVVLIGIIGVGPCCGALTVSDLCKALPWSGGSKWTQAGQVLTGERNVVVETDLRTGKKVVSMSCTESEVFQLVTIGLVLALILISLCCLCCCCCCSKEDSSPSDRSYATSWVHHQPGAQFTPTSINYNVHSQV